MARDPGGFLKSSPIAVVLAAGENGLGALRSLARAGVQTVAVAEAPNDLPLLSRFPGRRIFVPATPGRDPDEALLDALHAIPNSRPVLIPTSDRLVGFMVKYRTDLAERFDFVLPDGELASRLLDKTTQAELIAEIGIPLPKTVNSLPPSAPQLEAMLPFPMIVKPRSASLRPYLQRKTLQIADSRELAAFYDSYGSVVWALIAQEIIPGDDTTTWMCHCTFDHDHELVNAFTMRRLGMSPAHFGVTCYAISERNPEIVELVRRIGRGLGFVGPMGVDFKWDYRDGLYKYIELDPRVQLFNYLDAVCGVNNVLYAYLLAQGIRPEYCGEQREGIVGLNLYEDLYSRYKAKESVWRILRGYLRHSHRHHVGHYFRWNDPWPGVVTASRKFREIAAALARRIRRSPR